MKEIKEIDEIELTLQCGKISRVLPQYWNATYEWKNHNVKPNGLLGFAKYLQKIKVGLNDIKKFYEDDFNKDNSNSIDDYIALFNNILAQIDEILLDRTNAEKVKKTYRIAGKVDSSDLHYAYYKNLIKMNAFVYDDKNEMYGFTNTAYQKLVPLAKKIFMIEKMCSFTTRKFWQNEITDIKNFNLKKQYKIIARVMMPENWRPVSNKKFVEQFYQKKIYSSASIIDEKHLDNVFSTCSGKYAILILKFDNNKFVCADSDDAFSEEFINGANPYSDRTEYTDVNLVDEENINEDKHKLFSIGVELFTPKGILNKLKYAYQYSEVNLKNAEIVGVISPNKQSNNYAKEQAEKHNVPLYCMDKTPDWFEIFEEEKTE